MNTDNIDFSHDDVGDEIELEEPVERIIFKNPPILEAICEIRFSANGDWNPLLAVAFADRLRPLAFRHEIAADDPNLIQFYTEDNKGLVQLGANYLTVNHLHSYSSWEEYVDFILQAVEAYSGIADPNEIDAIELRYINQIEFSVGTVSLPDYFNFYPHNDIGIDISMSSFVLGIELPYVDHGTLKIRLFDDPESASTKNGATFILDLAYRASKAEVIEVSDLFDWLNMAHERIERAFLGCITPKLRERFEESQE